MKILTVVGARPQFIKAAVVSRSIAKYNAKLSTAHAMLTEIIVHTGQHHDSNMSEVFFEEMHIPKPNYYLGVNGGSHGSMTGRMLEKIEKVITEEKPVLVLVYGDTNSTLAGALAAVKLNIPVAHVEAGLRSFNMRMPEEVNRILTDRVSQWLFCPTAAAVKNLENEGFIFCQDRKTYGRPVAKNVGDVMYDAVLYYKKIAKPTVIIASLLEQLKDGFYVATVHRAENTDNRIRLTNIINTLDTISENIPVVLPLHPRTEKFMKAYGILPRNIRLIDPVGYFDMIKLISSCKGVFTDSGGLQKEAYFFQKPCAVLRDETEWIELLEHGLVFLIGSERKKILEAEGKFCAMHISCSKSLYGTGNAGDIIVKQIMSDMV